MKDNFSKQAEGYAAFRPSYPREAFDFILSFVPNKNVAWDCGTGNGQLAVQLAEHFDSVYATDISEKQIANATRKDNIVYEVSSAEENDFGENCFDLITVAQAIHWFDFDRFYTKVNSTLKNDGIIAAIGYNLPESDDAVNQIIRHLYADILGDYWDPERRFIDNEYKNIPFPFAEIAVSEKFAQRVMWTTEDLKGYLNTWSAVQHYMKTNTKNPVDVVFDDFKKAWGTGEKKEFRFPTLLRIGRIIK
jgi:2-polyprenyl-3-methyl-5-hydroxy-6-metoxy-1,4-benzoquinol methylase